MLGYVAAFVLHSVLVVGGASTYGQAYAETQSSGQPLLVLVGADWCPACRSMKQGVLTRMQRAGRLGDVSYAVVDADAQASLAGRLMQGGTIPQLIVFSRSADGQWHRRQITGQTSEGGVAALIGEAIALSKRGSESAIGN